MRLLRVSLPTVALLNLWAAYHNRAAHPILSAVAVGVAILLLALFGVTLRLKGR
jgi:hypothetical protein